MLTRSQLEKRARAEHGVRSLLTTSEKTVKSESRGILTGVLYLLAGSHRVCPRATPACREACLGHTAGRMVMSTVRRAQRNRTRLILDMFADSQHFGWDLLELEVRSLQRRALKRGMIAAVRLNGTSDINFFSHERGAALRESFPDVVWYDYTKRRSFLADPSLAAVDLTYSATENDSDEDIEALVRSGIRVAVVFRGNVEGLAEWRGLPVVNGDAHDARFLDPAGVVVALSAKGRPMRNDSTGFVRELP